MLLKDKVAIITGGAKGIGRGMALKFAEEGCTVAIADIAIKEAEEAVAEIINKGGEGIAINCDVTSGQQVSDTVEKVIKKYGRIDILVNNAGAIARHVPIEDLTEESWDKVLALNLKSDFLFCKYVVPHMKKRKYGKIINLSSIGAVQPPAHEIHYNTAKAGVIGFTCDLANALAPLNINVNCILPGPVRTSFYDHNIGSMAEEEKDKFFARLAKKVPMQRVGTPEDMAGAGLFLASELSAYITGQALYVAGGLPLQPPVPPPPK
ncbi:MAG: SDR family oxidoreductase [Dehalococcoidales bacterium]|nr:SDR family oxidoreductase [Dehalococcoidales bacterium]